MGEDYVELDVCVSACVMEYWGVDADRFEACIESCERKYGKLGKGGGTRAQLYESGDEGSG